MPFAPTWLDLEIIIVSKVSQRKTNIIIIYVDSKTIQSELTYKTEINFVLLIRPPTLFRLSAGPPSESGIKNKL